MPAMMTSQVWSMREVAGILAAMESVQPAIADELAVLRDALGAYYAVQGKDNHMMMLSDLEMMLDGLVVLRPQMRMAAMAFCRFTGARPPSHVSLDRWIDVD